jgi:hypothetical protein
VTVERLIETEETNLTQKRNLMTKNEEINELQTKCEERRERNRYMLFDLEKA